MRRLLLVVVTGACGVFAPPRATVTVAANPGPLKNAVLALPMTCESVDGNSLCDPRVFYPENMEKFAPQNSFAEMLEPIVRLKLELAGYTLVDARSLALEEVGRTETTSEDGGGGASIKTTERGVSRTVADLRPDDQVAAAMSLGLAGVLSTSLRITKAAEIGNKQMEVIVALRAVPEGSVLFTARCAELYEDARATTALIATCVGDGVLAWRAPDAVIGGLR